MNAKIEKTLDILKPVADYAADWVKAGEEYLAPSAVILSGIRRSLQLDTYSCGHQSCQMILQYFDKAGSIEDLKMAIGPDKDGTTESELLGYLRKMGLGVKSIPGGTIADIRHAIDSSSPLLARTVDEYNHWFVIYGYSDSCIWVLDPSLKNHLLCGVPKADFSRYWSGWCAAIYKKQRTYDNITLSKSGIAIAGLSISVKPQRYNII